MFGADNDPSPWFPWGQANQTSIFVIQSKIKTNITLSIRSSILLSISGEKKNKEMGQNQAKRILFLIKDNIKK